MDTPLAYASQYFIGGTICGAHIGPGKNGDTPEHPPRQLPMHPLPSDPFACSQRSSGDVAPMRHVTIEGNATHPVPVHAGHTFKETIRSCHCISPERSCLQTGSGPGHGEYSV